MASKRLLVVDANVGDQVLGVMQSESTPFAAHVEDVALGGPGAVGTETYPFGAATGVYNLDGQVMLGAVRPVADITVTRLATELWSNVALGSTIQMGIYDASLNLIAATAVEPATPSASIVSAIVPVTLFAGVRYYLALRAAGMTWIYYGPLMGVPTAELSLLTFSATLDDPFVGGVNDAAPYMQALP